MDGVSRGEGANPDALVMPDRDPSEDVPHPSRMWLVAGVLVLLFWSLVAYGLWWSLWR